MMVYKRKYNYWHKIIGASPKKKEELTKNGSKLEDLQISLSRPHKDDIRVRYCNLVDGTKSWVDVEYIGRLRIYATDEEICNLSKK